MSRPRSLLARTTIFGAALLVSAGVALQSHELLGLEGPAGSGPHPSPTHSPQDVVRIQLDALASNAVLESDGGIDIAYRFASPENRVFTGPIQRFRQIVRAPAFTAMFDQVRVEFAETLREGGHALQLVAIERSDGTRARFVFELSRQRNGPLEGCWMTDSVVPLDNDALPAADDGIAI